MHGSSPNLAAVLVVLAALGASSLVTACDTGDGRELSPPVLPPPTTTIATTLDTGAPADPAATTLPAPPPLALVAPWQEGAEIPLLNTCDGDDVSPALSWTGVPDGTVELALVVTDDDADGFVHWIVTGFDPAFGSMLEGQVPQGAREWPNGFGELAWNGPCPPGGSPHTYRFELHALNQQLEVADDTPVDELLALIDELTIGLATATGTYTR
ncbi:MAG: YbhB/YbcL family Raf kinase inhibitor-like protein [Ilumatobacteraceae bacterium]